MTVAGRSVTVNWVAPQWQLPLMAIVIILPGSGDHHHIRRSPVTGTLPRLGKNRGASRLVDGSISPRRDHHVRRLSAGVKVPDFKAASQGWLIVRDDVLTLATAGLRAA